jgi:Na+-transporting NADH:ubiquinone oxidoreductase subunit NqrA
MSLLSGRFQTAQRGSNKTDEYLGHLYTTIYQFENTNYCYLFSWVRPCNNQQCRI